MGHLEERQLLHLFHQHAQVLGEVLDHGLAHLRVLRNGGTQQTGVHHPHVGLLQGGSVDRVGPVIESRHLGEGGPLLQHAHNQLAPPGRELEELGAAALDDVEPQAGFAFQEEDLAAPVAPQAGGLRQAVQGFGPAAGEIGVAAQGRQFFAGGDG